MVESNIIVCSVKNGYIGSEGIIHICAQNGGACQRRSQNLKISMCNDTCLVSFVGKGDFTNRPVCGGGRCAHYDDLCLETFFASFLVTVKK